MVKKADYYNSKNKNPVWTFKTFQKNQSFQSSGLAQIKESKKQGEQAYVRVRA